MTLIETLNNWVEQQFGFVMQPHMQARIEREISHLLKEMHMSNSDFLEALQTNVELQNKTLHILTVKESYFFRDSDLFKFLKTTFLPQLILKKRQHNDFTLSILSAGCARGEEIYSIAILITQLLSDLTAWNVRLIGMDIDEVALRLGRDGIFSKGSLRVMDDPTKKMFFHSDNHHYILDPSIRKLVSFTQGNLNKLYLIPQTFDIIFCRNVFIYLTKEAILSALNAFHKGLKDEGTLFLGPADSILEVKHDFNPIYEPVLYLQKKSEHKVPTPIQTLKKIKAPPEFTHQISEALKHKEYAKVLTLIKKLPKEIPYTALLARQKATAHIGLNQLEQAYESLSSAEALDPLDPEVHYLKGLIDLDLKKLPQAKASFHKTLYLKNQFPEALYQLGLMYLQEQKFDKGLKLLQQSLIFLKKEKKDEDFIKAVEANIAYYLRRKNDFENSE